MPAIAQLAVLLATCKLTIQEAKKSAHLTVVVPLHCASTVLRPREEHPEGEALVETQYRQLQWLLADSKQVTSQLLYVDELCPQRSGALARIAARREGASQEKVRVVSVYDGMRDQDLPPGATFSPEEFLSDCDSSPLRYGAAYAYACTPPRRHPPASRPLARRTSSSLPHRIHPCTWRRWPC